MSVKAQEKLSQNFGLTSVRTQRSHSEKIRNPVMRIAYVVPYVPNLIRTRPFNLITELASQGHKVEVFTLGSGTQDLMDAQTLKGRCSDVHYHVQPVWRSLMNTAVAAFMGQPLQAVYSWQGGTARDIAKHISQDDFDIVHVEHLRGSRYATFIKSKFPTVPVIWDSVDCISHLFQQAAGQSSSFFGKFVTRFELTRTRKTEGDLLCVFDHVLVTSSIDQGALLELVPPGRKPSPITVVPNGVDLDYFHPNCEVQRDPSTIVLSGKMSYHANISMVKYLVLEIMPRVWQSCPEAQLLIVGKDPPADIKRLARNPLITVTGTVEDIRPFLWRATVSIVPLLYGAGIQNKILEAMATGTPVVTTPRALSALQVRVGRDLLVANDADDFAHRILCLIQDRKLQHAIGEAGLAYVRRKHDWTSIASQTADIYRQALDPKKIWLSGNFHDR